MNVDVIVIGSGQAGVPLAARLAGAGRRVLLCERRELGGTCTNDGCTPTKTMIASARAAHVARNAGRLGVRAAFINASGFADADAEGIALQGRLREITGRYGIALCGPNNLGLFNVHRKVAMWTPPASTAARRPRIVNSRVMITSATHGDARWTDTSATSAVATSSLSAVVSRNEPSLVVTPQRRASRPSNQSVAAATRNTTAATP